jgi:hypothetical protein
MIHRGLMLPRLQGVPYLFRTERTVVDWLMPPRLQGMPDQHRVKHTEINEVDRVQLMYSHLGKEVSVNGIFIDNATATGCRHYLNENQAMTKDKHERMIGKKFP